MKYVQMILYTTKSIKGEETAKRYFDILGQHGFRLEKIGQSEPVRQTYSLEEAISVWTREEEGCYVEDGGMVGKTGSIIGKSSKPRSFIQMRWWDCPNQVNLNWVSLNIADNWVDKRVSEVTAIFNGLVGILQAEYGFIGHDDTVHRQHVTGSLETRLPGVFWVNYFGPRYVEFFTEEKIKIFPWHSIEKLNGGLVTTLSDSPNKPLLTDEFENAAKIHLGSDSFGDAVEYLKNPRIEQRRRVPKLT